MWDDGLSLHDPYADWRTSAIMDVPFARDTSMLLANIFADFDRSAKEVTFPAPDPMKAKEIFATVHNATVGHWGAAGTWRRMNNFARGHGLSQREVSELVLHYANCAKNRRYQTTADQNQLPNSTHSSTAAHPYLYP